MHRRELLRVLGTAAALPMLGALTVEELLAMGHSLHERADRAGRAQEFQALSPHEARTVTMISEMIIPETDTAGATAAGVPQFIDLLVDEWYDEEDVENFRAGLAEVDARTRHRYGVVFVDAERAQRTAVLEVMESQAIRLRNADATPEPFFSTMKWLTLYGYYTSEAGAVQELNFEMIPGAFNGCEPVPPTMGGGALR